MFKSVGQSLQDRLFILSRLRSCEVKSGVSCSVFSRTQVPWMERNKHALAESTDPYILQDFRVFNMWQSIENLQKSVCVYVCL